MVYVYLLTVVQSISEETWILHTDMDEDELGSWVGGVYAYHPVVLRTLIAYYTGTIHTRIGVAPPIPMVHPLNEDTMNIHRQVILTREMIYGL